jgi:Zn ribbon nucleic-acid-binding protein
MASYLYCPTCKMTTTQAGTNLVNLFECKECGHVGCYGQRIITTVGCWKGKPCPRCNRSDYYKKIGSLD